MPHVPPLWVARTIVPRDRALLDLDVTPRRALRIILEHLQHLAHPAHIQALGEVGPFRDTRRTNKPAVFSRHAQSANVSQVLLEERTIAARDDVNEIPRVRSECRECREGVLCRDRHRGCLYDGCQGTL
jgi:hypothetical protein